MIIERLGLIGVGLIGGSLARALRRAGVVGEIVGCTRSAAQRERALALGVIDRGVPDPAAAADGCDMVVTAVPVGALGAVFEAVAPRLAPRAVITDVGSVKGVVIAAARAALGPALPRFVPGHPVAGTEASGVEASFAQLFEGHHVVLTPLAETERDAVARVAAMWRATGAEVEEMDAARHDRVLAGCSHLPHLLAYALVASLAGRSDASDVFRLAAGGFRDFTRIAASSPQMWTEILHANRAAVLAALDEYRATLGTLAEALAADDGDALQARLAAAKAVRDAWAAGRARRS